MTSLGVGCALLAALRTVPRARLHSAEEYLRQHRPQHLRKHYSGDASTPSLSPASSVSSSKAFSSSPSSRLFDVSRYDKVLECEVDDDGVFRPATVLRSKACAVALPPLLRYVASPPPLLSLGRLCRLPLYWLCRCVNSALAPLFGTPPRARASTRLRRKTL